MFLQKLYIFDSHLLELEAHQKGNADGIELFLALYLERPVSHSSMVSRE